MKISDSVRTFSAPPAEIPIRYTPPAMDEWVQPVTHSIPTTSATPAGVWYALSLRAQELKLAGRFDHLLAPDVLARHVVAHPYQLRVVADVLASKAPAAILADEVGLGKTIEAGLILKELLLRDTVHSALVVAPKALVLQWQDELREHFDEEFAVPDERRFSGYTATPRLICSFQQMVRAFEQINKREWDMLIVDEAHLLANPASKRRRCVAQLRTRWRLMLTATPLQNKITDLYSLIDLVSPGRLGTLRQFIDTYAVDATTCRHVVPARLPELRHQTHELMCRTRRSETGIAFAARTVDTYVVPPLAGEASMIRTVTAYLRAIYRRGLEHDRVAHQGDGTHSFTTHHVAEQMTDTAEQQGAMARHKPTGASQGALIREIVALQQSLSSSPQAIAASLRSRAARHPAEHPTLLPLVHACEGTPSAKEQVLLDALHRADGEQVLIFTLRLETAQRLRDVLTARGHTAECYVGELTLAERRALIHRFNTGAVEILIATDAGAEGLNLQERCHIIFNYDLHWNPMKMEQRIGRVHRLGQQHAVKVANFALAGSIDEYVLTLLYEKIDLFTMTVGALETMLAELDEGDVDIERRIIDLLLRDEPEDGSANATCGTPEHVRARIEHLQQELMTSLEQVRTAEGLTAEVLG